MSKEMWNDAYYGKIIKLEDSGLSPDEAEKIATKWANEVFGRVQDAGDNLRKAEKEDDGGISFTIDKI